MLEKLLNSRRHPPQHLIGKVIGELKALDQSFADLQVGNVLLVANKTLVQTPNSIFKRRKVNRQIQLYATLALAAASRRERYSQARKSSNASSQIGLFACGVLRPSPQGQLAGEQLHQLRH